MAQVRCVVDVALYKTRLLGGFELRWTWYRLVWTDQPTFEVWPYRGISTSYAHFRLGTIACMMPFLTPCQKSRKLTGSGQMIQRHTWANFATTSLGCRLRQGTGATTTATAINWVATQNCDSRISCDCLTWTRWYQISQNDHLLQEPKTR